MAREAARTHVDEGLDLDSAVVKAASAFEHPLTHEHLRRVCEMTYHDTFERLWKQASGSTRMVSFDPASAEKVVAMMHAEKVASAQVAHGSTGEGESFEKVASAVLEIPEPPRPANAFSSLMEKCEGSKEANLLEARSILRTTRRDLQDAIEALDSEIQTAKHAEWLAHREFGQQARQACLQGATPGQVLAVCEHFLKEAEVEHDVAVAVLANLASDMISGGIEITEKGASLDGIVPNLDHPLRARVLKVAGLRGTRVKGEIALDDLIHDRERVEREMRSALFQ